MKDNHLIMWPAHSLILLEAIYNLGQQIIRRHLSNIEIHCILCEMSERNRI